PDTDWTGRIEFRVVGDDPAITGEPAGRTGVLRLSRPGRVRPEQPRVSGSRVDGSRRVGKRGGTAEHVPEAHASSPKCERWHAYVPASPSA
ncbi:MAG TPA: hypothetical protein VL308_00185, partial [Gemmatimonadaceae bacterium]|nr:hypothetical protein [Gemmatimonadaceae bacterium]